MATINTQNGINNLYNIPAQKGLEATKEDKKFEPSNLLDTPTNNRVLNQQKELQNRPVNNTIDNTSNNLAKTTISNITRLNNATGFLEKARNDIATLNQVIEPIYNPRNKELTQAQTIEINDAITKTLDSTFNNTRLFNNAVRLSNDVNIPTANFKITPPPIENMSELSQINEEIDSVIIKINKIQSKIDGKVDKEATGLDYVQAKEDKIFDEQRLKDSVDQRNSFIDISQSQNTQKELLWLLR